MNRFYKKTTRAASALWAVVLLLCLALSGCSAPVQTPAETAAPVETAAPTPAETPIPAETPALAFEPGTYTASAPGNNGDVTISVTVSSSSIDAIVIDRSNETAGLGDGAMNTLIDAIITGQTLAVDTISGATNSSRALLTAVEDCLTQAGTDLDALRQPVQSESALPEDVTTDVLVIGGGGAGVVAAYNAAVNGAEVILVEKQGTLGGNTALAKGIFGCSASSFHKAQGAAETTEDHLNSYLAQYPNGDPEMLRILAENGGKAADFLMENGGEFVALGGPYVLVPKTSVGGMVISIYQEKMKEEGVDCRLNTAGTSLLTDETGAVVGAQVTTAGGDYSIYAKSVILTTGGFAANGEMVAAYNPVYEGIDFICTPGDTGDGHVMAEAAGAELAYMNVMKSNPFIVRDGEKHIMIGTYTNPGIVVNREGVRIGNEHANYGFAPAVLALPEKEAILICSEAGKDKLEAPEALSAPYDTIEALAQEYGIDCNALKTTLSEFAQYASEGADPFGRTIFVDDLSAGPYYAAVLNPSMQGTFGGIRINASCEAMRKDGSIIAGLYAAGECAGDGLWGANPVPTNCVFGKIAGESAAAFAKK